MAPEAVRRPDRHARAAVRGRCPYRVPGWRGGARQNRRGPEYLFHFSLCSDHRVRRAEHRRWPNRCVRHSGLARTDRRPPRSAFGLRHPVGLPVRFRCTWNIPMFLSANERPESARSGRFRSRLEHVEVPSDQEEAEIGAIAGSQPPVGTWGCSRRGRGPRSPPWQDRVTALGRMT